MTEKNLADLTPEERWTWVHANANAKKSVMPSIAALRDADRKAAIEAVAKWIESPDVGEDCTWGEMATRIREEFGLEADHD